MCIYKAVVTWFGCGRSPWAPGTVGSIATLPLLYASYHNTMVGSIALIFLVFLGTFCIHRYLPKVHSQDPKEVVVDEVAGQILTFLIADATNTIQSFYLTATLSIVLFRIFDIFKFWPICLIDRKIHGAFGIMLDDLLAGVLAGFICRTIMLLLL